MVEITGHSGTSATAEIENVVHENRKELTEDYAKLWFQESQDWLSDAASRRTEIGQRHGVVGREQNGLHAIHQNAIAPRWVPERDAWVFSYPHEGAVFNEFGTTPHEIRAKKAEVLAFEWPDAPQDVQERFEDTEGDLVFFDAIEHPGLPAIGFVRYGRRKAKRVMESAGFDTSTFMEGGGG